MPNSNPVCDPPYDVNCGPVVLPQVLYAQFVDASSPNGPIYFRKNNTGMPMDFRWTTKGHYEDQPDPPFGSCSGENSGSATLVYIEFYCPYSAAGADLNISIYNADEGYPITTPCGSGFSSSTSSASLDPFVFVYDSVVGPSADCLCCPWPGFDASYNVIIKASI